MAQRYHLALWAVALAVGGGVALVVVAAGRMPRAQRAARPRKLPLTGAVVAAVVVAAGVGVAAGLSNGRDAALVAAVAAAPELVRRVRRRSAAPDHLVAPIGVVSLLGVWAAVPDTEPAVVAAGVVALPAALAWRRGAGPGDRWAFVVAVVAAAWVGSAGRPELLGGLGCVGLLAVPPSVWRGRVLAPLAGHTALVVVSSRVITRWSWDEAASGLAAMGAAVLVTVGLAARDGGVRPGGRARPTPASRAPRRTARPLPRPPSPRRRS